jgi:hypothetical protein
MKRKGDLQFGQHIRWTWPLNNGEKHGWMDRWVVQILKLNPNHWIVCGRSRFPQNLRSFCWGWRSNRCLQLIYCITEICRQCRVVHFVELLILGGIPFWSVRWREVFGHWAMKKLSSTCLQQLNHQWNTRFFDWSACFLMRCSSKYLSHSRRSGQGVGRLYTNRYFKVFRPQMFLFEITCWNLQKI